MKPTGSKIEVDNDRIFNKVGERLGGEERRWAGERREIEREREKR